MIILSSLIIFFLSFIILSNFQLSRKSGKIEDSIVNDKKYDLSEALKCLSKIDGKERCLDEFMKNFFVNRDTKTVLAEIERARLNNSEIETNCHPITHSVGRVTYEKIGNIGDSFDACDQSCHSGCYHGVMERLFFSDKEISENYTHLTFSDMEKRIPGICGIDKFHNPNSAVIFQCLHGVGHAILYTLNYNLEEALGSCDLLESDYEKSSCYGGVIMENITAFDKSKRDLKQTDPNYPCNKLEAIYKYDCYMMQTSIMFEYGLSISQIINQCQQVGVYAPTCFVSLGRDLSNYVRSGDVELVRNSCEKETPVYKSECFNGAIFALIDNTWNGKFAYKLCKSIESDGLKNKCFVNANQYLRNTYNMSEKEIVSGCEEFAEDGKIICINSTK